MFNRANLLRILGASLAVSCPLISQVVLADDVPREMIVPRTLLDRPPKPKVDADSWIMLEIYPGNPPRVDLSAYFLDSSFERNQNLCEATKRVFEGEATRIRVEQKRVLIGYRLCLPLIDAVEKGYVGN